MSFGAPIASTAAEQRGNRERERGGLREEIRLTEEKQEDEAVSAASRTPREVDVFNRRKLRRILMCVSYISSKEYSRKKKVKKNEG